MSELVAINLRKLFLLGAMWFVVSMSMQGQVQTASDLRPSFDVISIKPSDPDPKGQIHFGGILVRDCKLNARSASVRKLIGLAYNQKIPPGKEDQRIVGGPHWIDSNPYDIEAKLEDVTACMKLPILQQHTKMELMLQSLLESRLRLKMHFETRDLPIYALVVAKGGPKLKAVPAPPEPVPGSGPPRAGNEGGPPPGGISMEGYGTTLQIKANAGTLSGRPGRLLDILQDQPEMGGRIVVDQTELTGTYSFSLNWARLMPDGTPSPDADAPSLFTALQEQLGLRLVATKGPVEVIVIDSIERPSEN